MVKKVGRGGKTKTPMVSSRKRIKHCRETANSEHGTAAAASQPLDASSSTQASSDDDEQSETHDSSAMERPENEEPTSVVMDESANRYGSQSAPSTSMTSKMFDSNADQSALSSDLLADEHLQTVNARMTAEVERLTEENHQLSALYSASRTTKSQPTLDHQRLIDTLKQELGQRKMELNKSEAKIRKLEATIVKHQSQSQRFGEEKCELTRARNAIDRIQLHVLDLTTQLSESEKKRSELLAAKKAIDEQHQQLKKELKAFVKLTPTSAPNTIYIRKSGSPLPHRYVKVPRSQKPTGHLHRRSIQFRVHTLQKLLKAISASDDAIDIAKLLSAYLSTYQDVGEIVARSRSMETRPERLTPIETLEMKSRANISNNQLRTIRSFLESKDVNILAPDYTLLATAAGLELKTPLIPSQVILVGEGGKEIETTVFCVQDLESFVKECWSRCCKFNKLNHSPDYGKKVWMAIGGDKGGKETKLTISFQNVMNPNSVRNIFVAAFYEGSDSAQNLRKALQPMAQQIENLAHLQLEYPTIDGTVEKWPLQIFLNGDMMFQDAAMGHNGPASASPCLLCKIPLDALQNPANYVDISFSPRTLEGMVDDAAKYETLKANGDKEAAKKSNSIVMRPLFPISLLNIPPPLLHILLGLTSWIWQEMVDAAGEIDSESIPKTVVPGRKRQRGNRQRLKRRLGETSRAAIDRKSEIDELTNMLLHLRQIESQLSPFTSSTASLPIPTDTCAASICIADVMGGRPEEKQTNMIECDTCGKWLHFKCILILTNSEILEASSVSPWECPACMELPMSRGPAAVLKEVRERLHNIVERLTFLKSDHEINQDAANRLEKILLNKAGEATKCLHTSLKSLGIAIQAYFGGSFVGNQAIKLITGIGPDVITTAFANNVTLKRKFNEFLRRLGSIYAIISKAQFLEDAEIENLEKECSDFKKFFIDSFHGMRITPKMHSLFDHVPAFANRHRTLGLISEQAIESLHQTVNKLYRRFACYQQTQKRQSMVYREHHIISAAALLSTKSPSTLTSRRATKKQKKIPD